MVNPYGWKHLQRGNSNGVDIIQNFPYGWNPGSSPEKSTYGGPAPFSEAEARFVRAVFEANPDICIMHDFHNFFGNAETEGFICVYAANEFTQHMAQTLVSRMTRKWRKEFAFIPPSPDYFVGRADGGSSGMIAGYAYRNIGIRCSSTFEICWRWRIDADAVNYNRDMCKAGVEALANWLLINLKELND